MKNISSVYSLMTTLIFSAALIGCETAPPTIQNLEPMIAPWSVIAVFGISVGVGVTFGLYPAFRAAQMDPIEALRHE